MRPTGPLDSEAELAGPDLETLVFQELRAVNDYLECGYHFYFWRTKNGLEAESGPVTDMTAKKHKIPKNRK